MIDLEILPQPDDSTCGPTSLHAVYKHLGSPIPLTQLIAEINMLEEGGTLAVHLGIDAIRRGFIATLFTYNLRIFDPSWKDLGRPSLIDKLHAQMKVKGAGRKFVDASLAYIHFLELGGLLRFDLLNRSLLHSYFDRGIPILAGLSATYLYECEREFVDRRGRVAYDDIRGVPAGHFVVLVGTEEANQVRVADPYRSNPISGDHYYSVELERLLAAILLGIITYDANLLVIENP